MVRSLSLTNYEHTYAGKRHLGNIDVTNQQQPVNGKVWRWEGGAGTPSADPIEAPQRSSQSNTQYYTINDERTIEKRSYQVGSVTAGDTNDDSRYAEWQHVNGAAVPTRAGVGVPSELFNAYAITLDADRASSAATNHALQLGATDLEYEVTRVKSPIIGRDMNPMGRGDGTYYANGGNLPSGASLAIRSAKPEFLGEVGFGYGNDINNCSEEPPPDWPPPGGKPPECFQPILYPVICNEFLPEPASNSCCNEKWKWHLSFSSDYSCRKCVLDNGLTPGAPIPPSHPCYAICNAWLYSCVFCMNIHLKLGSRPPEEPETDYCCRLVYQWSDEHYDPPIQMPCPMGMNGGLHSECWVWWMSVTTWVFARGPCNASHPYPKGETRPEFVHTLYWIQKMPSTVPIFYADTQLVQITC